MASNYSVRLIADTKQHDQALDKSAKEVHQYQMRIEGAKKNITGLIKKFAPFASAAGAVNIAIKEFGVAIKTNQQWADSYGRTMQFAKTANEQFIASLTEADFSGFISGLATARRNARELYDALDAVATQKILSKGKLAEYNAKLTEARLAARQGKPGAKDEIKKLEKLIEDEMMKQEPLLKEAIRAKIEEIVGWNSLRDGKLDIDMVLDWSQRGEDAIEAEIKRLKRLQNDLDWKYDPQKGPKGKTNASRYGAWGNQWWGAERQINLLEKIRSRLTDGDNLDEVQELISSYWALRQSIAQTKLGDTRYTKEETVKQPKTQNKEEQPVEEQFIDRLAEERKALERLLQEKSNIVFSLKVDNPSLEEAGVLAEQLKDTEEKIKEKEQLIKDIEAALQDNTEVKENLLEGSLPFLEDALRQLEEIRDNYVKKNDVENSRMANQQIKQLEEKIMLKRIELGLLEEEKEVIKQVEISNAQIVDSFIGVASSITSLGDSIADAFDSDAMRDFFNNIQKGINIINGLIRVMEALNKVSEIFNSIKEANTAATLQNTAAKAANTSAAAAETSAESGAAIAGATASGAKLAFPYNLIAIAAGVAAVIASLSLIGSFASGGIVGGNTTVGDHNIARVNAGEMILNKREQTRLWRVINGAEIQGSSATADVNFKIKGSDLVGVIDNYNSKIRRVR